MFGSSMGYSIDLHYCQDEIKGFSLIGKTKSCHDSAKKCGASHATDEGSEEEKNCCDNRHVDIQKSDQDLTIGAETLLVDIRYSRVLSISFLSSRKTDKVAISIPNDFYDPPPKSRDIPILFQSFLI